MEIKRAAGVPTAFAAVLIAVGLTLAPLARSATVIFAGGTTFGPVDTDPTGFNETFLGGAYKDDTFLFVDYPASLWPVTGLFDPTLGKSVDIGTQNMIALARSTPGPLVLAGVSQGAIVVSQVQAALDSDVGIPSSTTFIVISDPDLGVAKGLGGIHLPILDYTPQPLAETRFNTTVVINQYDGIADPIPRPWNVFTVLNAAMALIYVHPYAQDSDLSTVPPEDITTTTNAQGGITSTYHVPTQQLPLTAPLRALHVPSRLVDTVDDVLRPVIDAGYRPPGCGSVRSPASVRSPEIQKRRAAANASAQLRGSSSPPAAAGTSAQR